MIRTIYVESAVRAHPRTSEILRRFPQVPVVECDRYGEVFNRRGQNFRLQKQSPALILAAKHERFVHATPPGYGIGGGNNYYFSHMLNCIYDCRYCFLQGMFQSAAWVVFVNFEEFAREIETVAAENASSRPFFFSGYDCDSLAFDAVTRFAAFFLDTFERLDEAWIELRTKSTRVEPLLERQALDNCVVAFSFTSRQTGLSLESGVPSLEARLAAMRKLQAAGWKVGLRFDPLIYQEGWADSYRRLFDEVFGALDAGSIHSVSVGAFRLPRDFYRRVVKLYPEERLFASPLSDRDGVVSYRGDIHDELLEFCSEEVLKHVPEDRFFPCRESGEASL
jgi:spore photoproduct lyase